MPGPERLFSEERIRERIAQLAEDLRTRSGDGPVTLLGVLNGAALFAADLARATGAGAELAWVRARSYGAGTVSSGDVVVEALEQDLVKGARVAIVDTICDTGRTLASVTALTREAGAAEVFSCVLFDKPEKRVVPVIPDLVGFTVTDEFLVGYGLDHAGRYRALPYVGVLRQAHV
ncbi:MAG: phosphoribosyltransferase [Planctomycetota bacterium]|jgi:hypoxanthine phosphoribosyltransferase